MPIGDRIRGRIRHGLHNPSTVDPSLVLDIPFSEGVGNTVRDRSLYGNHGTIYGATWVDGKVGKALSFDGINDYVKILNDPSLDPLEAMSVCLWVKPDLSKLLGDYIPDTSTANYNILCKSWNDYAILQCHNQVQNGVLVFRANIGNKRFTITYPWGTLQDGAWAFLAMTCDGVTLNTWVNDNFQSTTTYSSITRPTTLDLIIGGYSPPTGLYYCYGVIYRVRIHNRALTPTEIQLHYNEGV